MSTAAGEDSKGEKELRSALTTVASAILDAWAASRRSAKLVSDTVKDGRHLYFLKADSAVVRPHTLKERFEHESGQYESPSLYWSLHMQDTCSMNKVIALALSSWPGGLALNGEPVTEIECLNLVPSKKAVEFARSRCIVTKKVEDVPDPADFCSVVVFRLKSGDVVFDVSCAQFGEYSHDVDGIVCPTVLRPLEKAGHLVDFVKDGTQSINEMAYELETLAESDRVAKEYLEYSRVGRKAIN